ncbi:vWA domain-containing protein [Enhygromyxa salina]|uniref:VWFA domain-containing protein n=1 Tax=Enhygromyxa salina TaxID=215803 RepID=A0A2S9XL67_9BACT|nr:vWA domain-containing protein [Enhygromyxa salina]PRP93619.1 hypothetical protein ENSA7_80470 [Enhygromyxa salina]
MSIRRTPLFTCVCLLASACAAEPEGRDSDTAVATLESGMSETETSAESSSGVESGGKLDLPEDHDLPSATTGECAAETIDPELSSIPVDILLVVDTSNSMGSAIMAVEASINVDFAQILADSGVDYRLIVLGAHSNSQVPICISSPLSNTDCNPPPPAPAINATYKHYDAETGSGAFLASILGWYATPDKHNLAPGGYQDFLRPEARKVFLGMTDGTSASGNTDDGTSFDAQLLGLMPSAFGTPGDRQYVFHLIVQMPANTPADQPWLFDDPIQGQGGSLQQVAITTGGWRFPLSETDSFNVLFQEIAEDVVATTPVACAFPIPVPDMGEIDPDTIEIDYYPGGQPPPIAFHQVVDLAACEPEAFYIANDTVQLCPEVCALVQADMAAQLDVRYGCDVGFDPAG